jgi:hypothetical protein
MTSEPSDELMETAMSRLSRIAEAHVPTKHEGGFSDSDCGECGYTHPCPTRVWATTARWPLATWDPTDDEEDDDE